MGLVGEDDVEGDVEVLVVDRAVEAGGDLADGEEEDARVRGQGGSWPS